MERSDTSSSPEVSPEFTAIIDALLNAQVKPSTIFEALQKPNKTELRLITTIGEREAAVLHLSDTDKWLIIKGFEDVVYHDEEKHKSADILAHHHPPGTLFAELPSVVDAFYATSSGKKGFILHANGITYFKGITTDPITGEAWIPKSAAEAKGKFFEFAGDKRMKAMYKSYPEAVYGFFERAGVCPRTISWEELPDENVFEAFLQE